MINKINYEKIGYGLMAMVFVNIDKSSDLDNFREKIVQFDNVLECHHVSGNYDYLLKIVAPDTKSLEEFVTTELKKITGMQLSNTIVIMSTLKDR